jgi:hypothetical protein
MGSLIYVTWTKELLQHGYKMSSWEQKLAVKINKYIGDIN